MSDFFLTLYTLKLLLVTKVLLDSNLTVCSRPTWPLLETILECGPFPPSPPVYDEFLKSKRQLPVTCQQWTCANVKVQLKPFIFQSHLSIQSNKSLLLHHMFVWFLHRHFPIKINTFSTIFLLKNGAKEKKEIKELRTAAMKMKQTKTLDHKNTENPKEQKLLLSAHP